jgi:hypothetical protein
MSLSKEAVEEFKEIHKKKFGKELSDEEAYESANNLVGLFRLLYECDRKEQERKHMLKKEPEGFHLTGGPYNCLVCHRQVESEKSWYDNLGNKCIPCQKAIKAGVIPPFVCKERDSYYVAWELKSNFGISHPTMRKLVRQGKLKARIVTYDDGAPYEYIFLKKENPDIIDPDRKSPARKSYDRNYNKAILKNNPCTKFC